LVLIYGDKYSGYGLVVSILAFGMVAASIAFAFSRALFAMERSDVDFKVNFIPLFILLTCGVWLVRSFGPIGAAFGLLLANMAATAVRFASFAYISRSFSSKKILSRT
jgi:O-antigen/teichoic acid export membrane protein